MELVTVLLSRVFWMFKSDEVRPAGGVYLPALVQHIASSFNFVKPPAIETWGQGLLFEHGNYVAGSDGRSITINSLTIHGGLLTVEVQSNTEDGEEVLNAAISTLLSMGFRKPSSPTTLLFYTGLVVDFGKPMDRFLSNCDALSAIIGGCFPYETQAHVHAIEFRLDPAVLRLPPELSAQNPTTFRMELRAGETFAQKRYYVEAHLRTKDVLSLLEELEGHL